MPRPQLLERLNEDAHVPLILISAPAGSGKTALAAAWLHDLRRSPNAPTAAWLSLDAGDNDPARFWSYVVGALQTVDPSLGAAALAGLQAPSPPPSETTVSQLINDVAAWPKPIVLVLDDYHFIDTPIIHQAVEYLVAHLPAHWRLVITTRSDPPLPLARLRARGQLLEVRAADLRFTFDETAHFLNHNMGLNLAPADVAALAARTEGWIAGLQLVALSVQGRSDQAEFVRAFTGSHAYIVDYLIDEVLEQQPPDAQEFLLSTSILDRLCGPLADVVVGRRDGQQWLEHFQRHNIFVLPLDDERRWYRYHHLFADVLGQLLRSRQPERLPELHRRASAWFEQHDLPAEAIDHAFAAGDMERAADLIERSVEELLKRSQHYTVNGWCKRLPDALVLARPRLSLARANTLLFMHELEAVERYLHAVEETAVHDPQADRLRGDALTIRARLANRRNDFSRAIEIIQDALQIIPPDEPLRRGQALLIFGIASFYHDRCDAAIRAFAAAAQLAEQAGDFHSALNAIGNQAITQMLTGKLHAPAVILQHALDLAQRQAVAKNYGAGALHRYLSAIYYEWNDLPAAAGHALTALKLSQASAEPYASMLDNAYLARVYRTQGDLPAAAEALATAWQIAREHQLPRLSTIEVTALQVRHWLATGELDEVRAWVRSCGLSADDELTALQEPVYIALARAQLATGEDEAATRLLARLCAGAKAAGRLMSVIEVQVLQALRLYGKGRSADAQELLMQTLALAEPEGFIRLFVDEGEVLRRLVVDALAQPGLFDEARLRSYAQRLLAAYPSIADETASAIAAKSQAVDTLVEPLTDRELAVLRLIAAGLSDRQAAAQLVVAVGTIKRHLNNLYGKLGVRSRTQAIARARELGLLA